MKRRWWKKIAAYRSYLAWRAQLPPTVCWQEADDHGWSELMASAISQAKG